MRMLDQLNTILVTTVCVEVEGVAHVGPPERHSGGNF